MESFIDIIGCDYGHVDTNEIYIWIWAGVVDM